MKLVKLIKIYLNETCSKICVGKRKIWHVYCSGRSEIRMCFIIIAFQLYCRICQQKCPRKWGRIAIEWNISAAVLCWCYYIGQKNKYIRKNVEALLEASKDVGI